MKFTLLLTLAITLLSCTPKQDAPDLSGLEAKLVSLQQQAEADQTQIESLQAQLDLLIEDVNDLIAENSALQTSLDQLLELEEDQNATLEGLRELIESNSKHIHKHVEKILKIAELISKKKK